MTGRGFQASGYYENRIGGLPPDVYKRQPQEYANIEHKLADTESQRDTLFESFTAPIREELDKLGVEYKIKARDVYKRQLYSSF